MIYADSQLETHLDTVIFVSVSCIIRLIVLPPLPMIRPIRLLCARIFSEISLQECKRLSKSDSSLIKEDGPFVGAVGLLLHHLEDAPAGVGAIFGVAVNGDGLLDGAHVVLSVHVHPRARLLRDLADCAALTADDSTNHVTLHQNSAQKYQKTN